MSTDNFVKLSDVIGSFESLQNLMSVDDNDVVQMTTRVAEMRMTIFLSLTFEISLEYNWYLNHQLDTNINSQLIENFGFKNVVRTLI